MTTRLPFSTIKRLLIGESGLRANGEAVGAFSEKLLNFAESESKRIAELVVERKRKTIYAADVEEEPVVEEEKSVTETNEEVVNELADEEMSDEEPEKPKE